MREIQQSIEAERERLQTVQAERTKMEKENAGTYAVHDVVWDCLMNWFSLLGCYLLRGVQVDKKN